MSATTLLTSLFQYKAWANQEIFATVHSLDPATHANERHAAIRLLNHIHVVDKIFESNLQGIAHGLTATNTPETPTLEALFNDVRDCDLWYIDYASTRTAQDMTEEIEFDFTDGTPARMSREEMLAHVIIHGAYHRGAVGRILAQVSVAAPRDLFTGYLHAAQPARRERGG